MDKYIDKEKFKLSSIGQFQNFDTIIEEKFEKRTPKEKREALKWAIKLAYKSNVLRLLSLN